MSGCFVEDDCPEPARTHHGCPGCKVHCFCYGEKGACNYIIAGAVEEGRWPKEDLHLVKDLPEVAAVLKEAEDNHRARMESYPKAGTDPQGLKGALLLVEAGHSVLLVDKDDNAVGILSPPPKKDYT